MCWICDLRDAAERGCISDHREAWRDLVHDYAQRHSVAPSDARDVLLHNVQPMPETYQ